MNVMCKLGIYKYFFFFCALLCSSSRKPAQIRVSVGGGVTGPEMQRAQTPNDSSLGAADRQASAVVYIAGSELTGTDESVALSFLFLFRFMFGGGRLVRGVSGGPPRHREICKIEAARVLPHPHPHSHPHLTAQPRHSHRPPARPAPSAPFAPKRAADDWDCLEARQTRT